MEGGAVDLDDEPSADEEVDAVVGVRDGLERDVRDPPPCEAEAEQRLETALREPAHVVEERSGPARHQCDETGELGRREQRVSVARDVRGSVDGGDEPLGGHPGHEHQQRVDQARPSAVRSVDAGATVELDLGLLRDGAEDPAAVPAVAEPGVVLVHKDVEHAVRARWNREAAERRRRDACGDAADRDRSLHLPREERVDVPARPRTRDHSASAQQPQLSPRDPGGVEGRDVSDAVVRGEDGERARVEVRVVLLLHACSL